MSEDSTKLDAHSFKNEGMFSIGFSKQYAFSREEGLTHTDPWVLNELLTYDENCEETYLKGYSRSYYLKDFHLESILKYNRPDPIASDWNMKIANKVKEEIRIELENSGIAPTSLGVRTELDQVQFVGSSSAGYGFLGKKGEQRGENHKRAMRIAKRMILDFHELDGEQFDQAIVDSTPYIGYTRTQLTNIFDKLKVRAVWGSPFQHIIAEGLSAQPFIEQVIKKSCFIHLGDDPIYSVPEKITQLNRDYKWIYTYDWSGFDNTTTRFEIDLAFDIIEYLMNFKNKEDRSAFILMRELFKYKKVVGPDGVVYTVNTGVPSGSYWTNIVDSIINKFRINYLWNIVSGQSMEDLDTHGDDGVGGSDIFVSIDSLAKEANKYGWTLNPDKCIAANHSDEIEFLGRKTSGGMSKRETDRCLRLLVFPEYPVESGRISAYRARSINEDVGGISERINVIANVLKRKYGVAEEHEVPRTHKRYTGTFN